MKLTSTKIHKIHTRKTRHKNADQCMENLFIQKNKKKRTNRLKKKNNNNVNDFFVIIEIR